MRRVARRRPELEDETPGQPAATTHAPASALLARADRERFEKAFAADFSSVRIHRDSPRAAGPDTTAMAELAVLASREAVQDVLDTGGTVRAERALDFIPDLARVAGGPFQPIASFSDDPAVWDPVLQRALSRSPADNDLYQMVKGNIVPMGTLKARQAARAVGEAAESVWDSIASIPDDAARWLGGLEREIERLYGVPY